MKNKISEFINKTFFIFGIIIFFLALESLVVGDSAKEVTTIFAIDGFGLPTKIIFQFLGLSMVVVVINQMMFHPKFLVNFSDKNRLILTVGLCFIAALLFIVIFKWFEMDSMISWGYFILCFLISYGLSNILATSKEKRENKKLEEALKEYKAKLKESREVE